MTASGYQATLRPLQAYEPRLRQAMSAAPLPERQRPEGQLSLQLWVRPQQARPGLSFDRDKLAAVLRAVVEAYAGNRNVRQLRHALHPDLYQQLAERSRTDGRGYVLKTVHASSSAEGVIEACGLVHSGGRALAMCARFDKNEHGWLCTEFTVMEPRKPRAKR